MPAIRGRAGVVHPDEIQARVRNLQGYILQRSADGHEGKRCIRDLHGLLQQLDR